MNSNDSYKRMYGNEALGLPLTEEPALKRPPAADVNVVLLVSHAHAGAVIGPKGATLATLRDRTGCRCTVESQPTPEGERCVLVCGGTSEGVCEAVDGVLTAVYAAQNPPPGATVLVPLTAVGTLIGKGGANINQMRTSTGCNVQVPKDKAHVLGMFARCELTAEESAMNGADHAHNSSPSAAVVVRAAARLVAKHLFEHGVKQAAAGILPPPPLKELLAISAGYSSSSGSSGGGGGLLAPPPNVVHASGLTGMGLMGYGPGMRGMSAPPHPGGAPHAVPPGYASYLSSSPPPPQMMGNLPNGVPMPGVPPPMPHHHAANYGTGHHVPMAPYTLPPGGSSRSGGKGSGKGGGNSYPPHATRGNSHHHLNHPQHHMAPPLASPMLPLPPNASVSAAAAAMLAQTAGHHLPSPLGFVEGGGMLSHRNSGGAGITPFVVVAITIPKKFLGHVIGKGGKYFNAIRQAFNVDLKVDDSDPELTFGNNNSTTNSTTNGGLFDREPAALVSVSGSREAVWQALAKCAANLQLGAESDSTTSDGNLPTVSETLHLEASSLSKIIGKGGARISLIRQASHCKVTIEQPKDGVAIAPCLLEGKPREVLGARMLVEAREIVVAPNSLSALSSSSSAGSAANTTGADTSNPQNSDIAGGVGTDFSHHPKMIGAASGATAHTSCLELQIPKKFLGHVIGKGGKYINAARMATGCDIKVNEHEGPPSTSSSSSSSSLSDPPPPISATLSVHGVSSANVWAAAAHVCRYLLSGHNTGEAVGEADAFTEEALMIPADQVGSMIGKGGTRINLIRQASGGKINLVQPEGPSGPAVAGLAGGARSVLVARILLTAREGPQQAQPPQAQGQLQPQASSAPGGHASGHSNLALGEGGGGEAPGEAAAMPAPPPTTMPVHVPPPIPREEDPTMAAAQYALGGGGGVGGFGMGY